MVSSVKKLEWCSRKAYCNHSLQADSEFGLILREIVTLLFYINLGWISDLFSEDRDTDLCVCTYQK